MTSLLKGVIARGTATDAASLGEEIAGKTGTTDESTDAWFVGYSPSLVLGVWVGKDDKQPLGPNETGAIAALPIWMDIMRLWLSEHPGETFKRPPGIKSIAVDARTGLTAGVDTGCQEVILEDLRRNDPEPGRCSHQAHLRSKLPYYLQRYPWLDEDTLALSPDDLARVLREAPLEVQTEGSGRLTAMGDEGPVNVGFRIVPSDDPSIATLAGSAALAGFPAAAAARTQGEDPGALVFPPDLCSINGDPATHPTVGIDGRAAAVLTIRYP
jgi:membrane peptidoglycan carboxypeptidase